MRKCTVIADFLSADNKKQITECASETGFEVAFFESTEEADGKVSDTEVFYSGGDASILEQMPALKWCHTAFAGVGAYAASGIFDSGDVMLTNSSGAYGRTISEHIIMVTLMLMRRMPEYNGIIYRHEWTRDLPLRSVAGSNIVIAGTGDIGSNAAARYHALGAKKVTGFNRSGRPAEGFDEVYRLADFDRLFGNADFSESVDVLVLCIPGTAESQGIINAERISMLSRNTYVINVGRGWVIDQDALLDALNEGRIAGAALDVMYPEPLPEDHPLWTAPNCIVTPHMSGDMGLPYTVEKTVEFFCENLRHYAEGSKMIKQIDIKKGY